MNDYAKKIAVKADLEHLQKLFIMPDSADKFLEFGHELLGLIHHFFQEKGGIHSSISLPNLAKIFSNIEIPQSPHLLKDVLSEIKNKVIAHSVKVGSPYYIGHMTSAIPYFMVLLEMIIASLNQNQVKIETAKASSFVEREILAWIHNLIFNRPADFYKRNIQDPKIALGNVTLDGTIANMTGLLVARNKAFPASGKFPGIRKAGVHEAFRYYNCKRAVILVSKRGHYSIDKIARTIGLGDENVIKVPVDSCNKIDIHRLRKICHGINEANQTEDEKTMILCLIGIAGTTETGNVDNLVELREIADEYNTTFHVDAAWGGSVLLVDQFRPLLKGIESADSVTFDAHKLLYSPLSMGMILFKNEKDLNNLAHTANYIIRPDSVDQGRFTIEGSRPFSCLKPWATFKILGKEGFRLLFEHASMLTSTIKKLTEEHENFEALSIPELFIYNYRFIPNPVKECLNSLMAEIGKAEHRRKTELKNKIKNVNDALNEMNIELHRRIRMEDNSFVSRTMLESTKYFPQRIVVLRTVTINPLTTPEILKEIIDEQNALGMNLYKTNFAKLFSDI
ncbi:MAG: pyridoxal-dependent decarboxylase [Spirochaetes bacterium]|jgi:glutamate decarboxylase|nr:pyridoxal-dependent decarboxylase [Spirochaetota bacterium]